MAKRFEEKVRQSISENKPLECFGYYLPAINFVELLGGKSFSQQVYFIEVTFYEGADFSEAIFYKEAYFSDTTFTKIARFSNTTFSERVYFAATKFLGEAYFLDTVFAGRIFFRYTVFEQPNKIIFDSTNLSKVSFADSDITKVKFGDKIEWGGKEKLTIIEEEWLKNVAEGKESPGFEKVSLGLVLSVYRNLRENYEFRLRYDEAGELFVKEMELKRKYRETKTETGLETKENDWFRRHFSLTGLYYLLSRYGESVRRPAIIGAITLLLPPLIWIVQSNNERQNAFERGLTDFLPFLPFLPFGGDTKIDIWDLLIKIIGALTLGLLIIALRRRFERKYTR